MTNSEHINLRAFAATSHQNSPKAMAKLVAADTRVAAPPRLKGPGVGKRTPSKSKGSVAQSMRHYHTLTPRSNKALR